MSNITRTKANDHVTDNVKRAMDLYYGFITLNMAPLLFKRAKITSLMIRLGNS